MIKTTVEDKEARAYNWALLATVVLLIALLSQAPSRLLQHFLPASWRTTALSWGGTLWNGQVDWQLTQLQTPLQGQVRWHINPWSWLRLQFAIETELLTPNTHMMGQVVVSSKQQWALKNWSGQLAPVDIQPFLANWQLPSTAIQCQNLNLQHKADGWQGSQGQLTSAGGLLRAMIEGQQQSLNLPAVSLTVQGQAQQLMLTLQQQDGAPLANFNLIGDQLQVQLRQRLLQYAANYHGSAAPDTIVVSASQPLSSL